MPPGAHPQIEVGGDLARLTAGSFLADIGRRHGTRTALVFQDREITYRQLETAARDLARALVGAGVVKGARIAALVSNRPEWIETFFAASLIGAVFVPINTFATGDERDYILRHSDASLLILQPSLLNRNYLDELVQEHPELATGSPGSLRCEALPQLRRVVSTSLRDQCGTVQALDALLKLGADVPHELLDELALEVHSSDDGIIIYTSGTTARPKGVLHMQRALLVNGLRFSRWMELSNRDRVWTAQPFFWTAGITMSLVSTLDAGACLILEETFDAGRSLALIESQRATTIHAWAHQEEAMAEHPSVRDRNLTAVRNLYATSPLAVHAPNSGQSRGLQGSYGLSETFTIFATLPADTPEALRLETSGKALPGNRLRIVDPETREELPTGEFGEIAVKGFTLMRGYTKVDPEQCFDTDGFFGTQDGGFVDSAGYLHWTGRMSSMIKTGGANVSPLEVEAALADYAPLKVGMAVGVPHPTLGEAIVLCVVPGDDAGPLDEDALRDHLRERLAAYKVPRLFLTFRTDELSYTGNQKIAYAPLRERALARLEEVGVEIAGHRYGSGT